MICRVWIYYTGDDEKMIQYVKYNQIIQPAEQLIVEWFAAGVSHLHEKSNQFFKWC